MTLCIRGRSVLVRTLVFGLVTVVSLIPRRLYTGRSCWPREYNFAAARGTGCLRWLRCAGNRRYGLSRVTYSVFERSGYRFASRKRVKTIRSPILIEALVQFRPKTKAVI